jgi:hypothetical protein
MAVRPSSHARAATSISCSGLPSFLPSCRRVSPPPPLPLHALAIENGAREPHLALLRRAAAARRSRTARAIRSARTAQIKRALTPLIGPRWTDGQGPPRRSTALRQPCVSPANRGQPHGTPSAHPPAALAVLQKGPPVSGIHNHAHPPIEIL